MEQINTFLQESKAALACIDNDVKSINVILGNESCDLDSAICALVYGYFLFKSNSYKNTLIIPILNIPSDEFPLRTETKYFLEQHGILHGNLVFRNQINLTELSSAGKLKLILVDHHVLPVQDELLKKDVIEIIDHRPVDHTAQLDHVKIKIIDEVGSCATLVANKIFENDCFCLNEVIGKLLHGTIVLDTINFDPSAKRFKPQDLEIVKKLEQHFQIPYSRSKIFQDLVTARSDISQLTPFQILHRDMKVVHGIPFPGVPMLVADFLRLSGSTDALRQFCSTKNSPVVVIMGLVTRDGVVSRDIGVYERKKDGGKGILNCLLSNDGLKLNEIKMTVDGLRLFEQGNVKMSRKQIIPILIDICKSC